MWNVARMGGGEIGINFGGKDIKEKSIVRSGVICGTDWLGSA